MTDRELTKQILSLAGYEVVFGERVYMIVKDGKKVQAGSSELTPQVAIKFVQMKSYHEGVSKGIEMLRGSIRKTLGL